MADIIDLRRDIPAFLSSLRHSVEASYRAGLGNKEEDRERFLQIMLLIEEARLRYSTAIRYGSAEDFADFAELRSDVFHFLNKLILYDDDEDSLLRGVFSANYSGSRTRKSVFMESLDEASTVLEAVVIFRAELDRMEFNVPVQTALDFSNILRFVPEQQLAPARFHIRAGKIAVADLSPEVREEDKSNVKSALEHLRGTGLNLLNSLEQSNCDRRLLDSVKELHSQIAGDQNIIKIGLTNMACGMMSTQFQEELPSALNAMFNSYSASVSLYVAQFPEWEQFTQRAATIELDSDNIAEIDDTAIEVIKALEDNPKLAEPEVPKTIKLVRELISRPGATSKRAAFAMMRTLENLVSSIVHHTAIALSKVVEKVVEDASTAASKTIAGLLGIALISASGIGTAAVQAGAPWVRQAAELVQKQIDDLAAK